MKTVLHFLLCAHLLLAQVFPFPGPGRAVVGGGGGPAAFSDDFNRSDSEAVGGCFSEPQGNSTINTNRLRFETTSFAHVIVECSTSTVTVGQYAKVTLSAGAGNQFHEVILRYTDSSSPFYYVGIDDVGNSAEWGRCPSVAGSCSTIASSALTFAVGDILGVTVVGTSTGTEVRIWKNPTNLPSSSTNWDGDTTPDVTFTTDPGTPVDTGTLCGLGVYQAVVTSVDDWFCGGLSS